MGEAPDFGVGIALPRGPYSPSHRGVGKRTWEGQFLLGFRREAGAPLQVP